MHRRMQTDWLGGIFGAAALLVYALRLSRASRLPFRPVSRYSSRSPKPRDLSPLGLTCVQLC